MSALPEPTQLHKPEAAWVPVDPAMAKRFLAKNPRNRKSRRAVIHSYARDMLAGNWRMTGEAIKFAPDGTLLDGQHRLAAIIKADTTVTMLVIRNVSTDAQSVMDSGAKRTASDALSLTGTKHATLLAATARLAIQMDRNDVDSNNSAPTHSEIAEWVDANPRATAACEFSYAVARRADCPPAVVAYTYFILSQIDLFDAASFWNAASSKVGLVEGDPVIALTNRFAEARRTHQVLPKRTQISLIYRAWNARRAGKTMKFIRVNSAAGGLVPIPEPR